MTQALDVTPRCKVLEVGAGSGYQAAILARLARRVYAIERYRELALAARARIEKLGLANVTIRTGDGTRGWPEQAPFDRIIVSAAAEDAPALLLEQLRTGGIMVLPVGQSDEVQQLIRVEKTDEGPSISRADGGALRAAAGRDAGRGRPGRRALGQERAVMTLCFKACLRRAGPMLLLVAAAACSQRSGPPAEVDIRGTNPHAARPAAVATAPGGPSAPAASGRHRQLRELSDGRRQRGRNGRPAGRAGRPLGLRARRL